jgi:hypothetical protein
VFAAATIALALSGCGSSGAPSKTVNSARVSSAIAATVRSKRSVHASVSCPSGVPLKQGTQFFCIAQTGAHITAFHVTETNESGHVSFVGVSRKSTPLLATTALAKAIGASILRSRHVEATVRCPNGMPRQRGLSFVCSATDPAGKKTLFEVHQLDSSGHVNYRGL